MRDAVLGSIYAWVTPTYHGLRFGAAAESAFEVVRKEVDAALANLIPDALAKLAAAFESAASGDPEHWANAASTCRRALKSAADRLRPPGEPKGERLMSDPAYVNRLVDWVVSRPGSNTAKSLIFADLEYLGRRLDAADAAGHKGAHGEVDRFEASRFLVGTYLLLGDLVRLGAGSEGAGRS